jgi:GPH family glycoside/pentoside/hexuronide:cation symporter
MASAISADPGDRQSLSTYRTMGGMLAGAVIGILVPLVAYKKVNGQETLVGSRVTLIAAVFSLLAIGCYLLCYFLTTERVRPRQTQQQSHSTIKMLKNAVKNRSLISIIAASIVMLLAQLTMQGMAGYIYPEYYNSAGAQSASTIVMMAAMGVSAAFAKPLAARFGKAEVSVVSNFFAAGVCILTFFWRPENVWVFVALQGLNWLGLGIFSMVSWALITDVIDDSEIRTGVREDGSVYALYSFARKLGQAAAAGLSGALLSLIGYSDQTKTDPAVLDGVFNISTLVPAIGFAALALILWLWYPLHKKQVDANVAALKEKHANDAQ